MAIVKIVIPSYRGVAPEAATYLQAMITSTQCNCRDGRGAPLHAPWKCTKGKHCVIQVPPIMGSSVVHWARNQVIAQGMYGHTQDGIPPADYFLLMDDDMTVEPHYLLRMLAYKLDIVTGIATIRRDPPTSNIRFWSEENARFVNPFEWDWDAQKLFEIDGVGGAFMLVKRDVLERMSDAHLNCEFEIDEDLRKTSIGADEVKAYWAKVSERRKIFFAEAQAKGEWRSMDGWWFQFLRNIDDRQIGEVGEDISFCWKAKRLGYRIFADPQVLPGHLGMYAYSGRDYRVWAESAKQVMEIPEHALRENRAALFAQDKNANDGGWHPDFSKEAIEQQKTTEQESVESVT
jgi:hypothetical protein